MQVKEQKKPILPVLKNMQKGQQETWPLSRKAVVCSVVYDQNIICGKRFSAHVDREKSVIMVKRIK